MDARFTGLLDMINGGGAGQAGQSFEDGPLSGLLNMLGIRPKGFRDREAEQTQQMLSPPRASSMGGPAPMTPPMGYAGRPDVPMGGGMPAAALPNTLGGISMPGQPTLTPEQIQQLLMALNMMPQSPMSAPPMGSAGGDYDNMYRGAMIPPTSLGYGAR